MATTVELGRNYTSGFGNGPVNDPIRRKTANKNAIQNVNTSNTGNIDSTKAQGLTWNDSSNFVELETTDTTFPSFFVPTKCQTSENPAFPNVITALKELSESYDSVAGSVASLTLCSLFADLAQTNIAQTWSDEEIANMQEMITKSITNLGVLPETSNQEDDLVASSNATVSSTTSSVTLSTSNSSSSSSLSNASIVSMMMEMITIIYSLLQQLEAEQRAMQLQASVEQQTTANNVAAQVISNAEDIRNQQKESASEQLTGAFVELGGAGLSTAMTGYGVSQEYKASSLEHSIDMNAAQAAKGSKDITDQVTAAGDFNDERAAALQASPLFNQQANQQQIAAITNNTDDHLIDLNQLSGNITNAVRNNEVTGIHGNGATGEGPREFNLAANSLERTAANNAPAPATPSLFGNIGNSIGRALPTSVAQTLRLIDTPGRTANSGLVRTVNAHGTSTYSASAVADFTSNVGVAPIALNQNVINSVNADDQFVCLRPLLQVDNNTAVLARSNTVTDQNNITTETLLVHESAVAANANVNAHPKRLAVYTITTTPAQNVGQPPVVTYSVAYIISEQNDLHFDSLVEAIDNRRESVFAAEPIATKLQNAVAANQNPPLNMNVTTFNYNGNRYDTTGRRINANNRFINNNGDFIDANNNRIDADGNFVNAAGEYINPDAGDYHFVREQPVRTTAQTTSTALTSPLAYDPTLDTAFVNSYNDGVIRYQIANEQAKLLLGAKATTATAQRANDGVFGKITAATREGMMGQGSGDVRQRLAELTKSAQRWQTMISSLAQSTIAFGRAGDSLFKQDSQVTSANADLASTANNQLQSTMRSLLEYLQQIVSNESSNISTLMQTLTSFMKTALDATISAQSRR